MTPVIHSYFLSWGYRASLVFVGGPFHDQLNDGVFFGYNFGMCFNRKMWICRSRWSIPMGKKLYTGWVYMLIYAEWCCCFSGPTSRQVGLPESRCGEPRRKCQRLKDVRMLRVKVKNHEKSLQEFGQVAGKNHHNHNYIFFADRTRTVELVNSILEKALFTLLGVVHGHFCFKDGGPGKNWK